MAANHRRSASGGSRCLNTAHLWAGRYLEDFTVAEVIESAEEYEMTPQRIAEFAAEFDPQPIHLDPDTRGSAR